MPDQEEPDYDGPVWQNGFWAGYRLGVVRGRIQAWIRYMARLANPDKP